MVSVETTRYLAAVEKRLDKIKDPVARARAANDEIAANADVLAALARLRGDAVHAARETMSAQAVAVALGVTRARVYQLLE